MARSKNRVEVLRGEDGTTRYACGNPFCDEGGKHVWLSIARFCRETAPVQVQALLRGDGTSASSDEE